MDQLRRSIEHLAVYDIAGPRDAFPIVLVHGAAWTRNAWVPQMEALSDELRVIAVDLPGHGTLREQPFRLEAGVQAVIKSLRHQTYRELASHDYYALLQAFTGPVLIVNGEHDKPNRKREAALLRAAQDGQIQIVKQAGHLCNLEQPEAFTYQVRTFAKQLSGATTRTMRVRPCSPTRTAGTIP